MKALLLTLLLFNSVLCSPTTVYLCDSPNATRYHLNAKCRGLSNCSHRIIATTLEKAKKMNLTLCKWER
jgi:hypothetical protein